MLAMPFMFAYAVHFQNKSICFCFKNGETVYISYYGFEFIAKILVFIRLSSTPTDILAKRVAVHPVVVRINKKWLFDLRISCCYVEPRLFGVLEYTGTVILALPRRSI
jgi:hypothetical protein